MISFFTRGKFGRYAALKDDSIDQPWLLIERGDHEQIILKRDEIAAFCTEIIHMARELGVTEQPTSSKYSALSAELFKGLDEALERITIRRKPHGAD